MKILIIGSEGYAGSTLARALKENYNWSISTCDLLASVNSGSLQHISANYSDLDLDELAMFDVIILLAAHSSVKSAMDDPEGAIRNNLIGLHRLMSKISQNQLLIFASSGSVYDGYGNSFPDEKSPITKTRNIYDFTKISGDLMASSTNLRAISLRLGTLTGNSPKLRPELIVNKMTLDAVKQGRVLVSNENSFRSCLDLRDFTSAITTIITNQETIKKFEIFNLASFSMSVDDIALAVSNRFSASIIYLPPSPTYDFSMSTKKFEEWFNFRFNCDLILSVEAFSQTI